MWVPNWEQSVRCVKFKFKIKFIVIMFAKLYTEVYTIETTQWHNNHLANLTWKLLTHYDKGSKKTVRIYGLHILHFLWGNGTKCSVKTFIMIINKHTGNIHTTGMIYDMLKICTDLSLLPFLSRVFYFYNNFISMHCLTVFLNETSEVSGLFFSRIPLHITGPLWLILVKTKSVFMGTA